MKYITLLFVIGFIGCGEDNSALAPHATPEQTPVANSTTPVVDTACTDFCKAETDFQNCLKNPFGMCMPPIHPTFCGQCK
jgi:hypothetical protein